MLSLEDVTAPVLKSEEFPGCAPAPLSCTPEGKLHYGKTVKKVIEKVVSSRYSENSCWPSDCLPDDPKSCSPNDGCSPDYSYCSPD